MSCLVLLTKKTLKYSIVHDTSYTNVIAHTFFYKGKNFRIAQLINLCLMYLQDNNGSWKIWIIIVDKNNEVEYNNCWFTSQRCCTMNLRWILYVSFWKIKRFRNYTVESQKDINSNMINEFLVKFSIYKTIHSST